MKTTKTITVLMLGVITCFAVTFGDVLNDEDSLTPAAFADVDDNVFAATTSAPILLHRGTVLETSADLSFDYGYHPVSGKQTLVVRDVDTTELPTIITNGSENVVAWKDKLPFSRGNSLAKALNQTKYQEYDERGRLVKTVGNDNVSEFVIYDNNRRIQISAWDAKTKQPTLPIKVIETNDAGNVTSIYSVSPTNVL
ncbi:MAG: hypothetical protein LBU65_01275, partial [Planctomycetaceae bacterium]|nr:hypothetical protein [Planctomycetaceae bacterium]